MDSSNFENNKDYLNTLSDTLLLGIDEANVMKTFFANIQTMDIYIRHFKTNARIFKISISWNERENCCGRARLSSFGGKYQKLRDKEVKNPYILDFVRGLSFQTFCQYKEFEFDL